MLEILFKGVLMSCEIEATIISDNFSIDLAYSEFIISVISFKMISLAGSKPNENSFYLHSSIIFYYSPPTSGFKIVY